MAIDSEIFSTDSLMSQVSDLDPYIWRVSRIVILVKIYLFKHKINLDLGMLNFSWNTWKSLTSHKNWRQQCLNW